MMSDSPVRRDPAGSDMAGQVFNLSKRDLTEHSERTMQRFQTMKQAAIRDRLETGLPRSFLRHLLERLRLGIGSRLLIAGRQTRNLSPFLQGLGIEVTDLSESWRLAASYGALTFRNARFDYPADFSFPSRNRFDAVLAAGLAAYEQPVFDEKTLRTTASLLATIRPAGRLVLFSGGGTTPGRRRVHAAECFTHLLEVFAGDVDLQSTAAGVSRLLSTETGWTCALTVSTELTTRMEWLSRAKETAADRPLCRCESRTNDSDGAILEAA